MQRDLIVDPPKKVVFCAKVLLVLALKGKKSEQVFQRLLLRIMMRGKKRMITIQDLYDLNKTVAQAVFAQKIYPWEVLDLINSFILASGPTLPPEEFDHLSDDIWIAKDAKISASAEINGPCIIDRKAEIRHCAFIRGNAIVGKNCVVGNSTELKNVILFDNVQVPHYNYVGDSVIGYKSHLGAGAITSNVKSDKSAVCIKSENVSIATGRKKLGAMLGDFVEVGCNSVLNPGTVVCKNSNIYPLSCVRGIVPPNSIYKNKNEIMQKTD